MKSVYFLLVYISIVCLGCKSNTEKSEWINQKASPKLDFSNKENPFQWQIITTRIDRKAKTMSILYGNDIAINYANDHSDSLYPQGSKLAFVTWAQKEDAQWFGANSPNSFKSIEWIIFDQNKNPNYSVQYGKNTTSQISNNAYQIAKILSYKTAVLPK